MNDDSASPIDLSDFEDDDIAVNRVRRADQWREKEAKLIKKKRAEAEAKGEHYDSRKDPEIWKPAKKNHQVDTSGFKKEKIYDNAHRRAVRGDMLKIIRLKKGLEQKDMAKLFKISRVRYNQVENGQGDMSIKSLDEGLHLLGIGRLTIAL